MANCLPAPIPKPEVPARLAAEEEIPRGALIVMRRALNLGWHVTPTYARGPLMMARGIWIGQTESIALRMSRGANGAVGLWFRRPGGAWKYEGGYTWPLGGVIEKADAAKLKAWLAQPIERGTDELH